MSYSAESLAHGMLPGLVLAALAGVPLAPAAPPGSPSRRWRSRSSAACRESTPTSRCPWSSPRCSGSACCWRSRPTRRPVSASCLFGDVLAVTDGDLLLTAAAARRLDAGAAAVAHAGLLAVGFDPQGGALLGRSAARYDALLAVLLALATLAAVQALGSLLVVAMLVGPAATAGSSAAGVRPMMGVATAVAALCRSRRDATPRTTPRPARGARSRAAVVADLRAGARCARRRRGASCAARRRSPPQRRPHDRPPRRQRGTRHGDGDAAAPGPSARSVSSRCAATAPAARARR